ncbi:c-type cytochrome [Celeribacter persicus]|uniref:Sulfur dehydrogenase subunit SoxD n=1 Tax=Celeribacter persicus TaxID=1651082 RepID=A0A2T5HSF1_9RHOB|nr:c-type cytochrome [Celeribacter persicus]PTQ74515.1 sulfur dehydrogenase subunit SoxD [Celeribacter persicus]
MSKFLPKLTITTALVATLAMPAFAEKLGLGRAALPEEIAAWNHDISPNGEGLPVGSGSVEDGEMIFSENCAVCHGEFAEGVDNWPKLAGGDGTLADKDPLKTIGSYWPYLSTVYDYVRRSMPFGAAQTMSDDDVYAITAYLLYSNYLVDDDFVLSNENFLEVEMPNAGGFIVDDRPETEYTIFTEENACYENCKDTVEITRRATVLDVTPEEEGTETVTEAAVVVEEAVEEPVDTPAVEEAAQEPVEAPAEEAPVVAAMSVDPELAAQGEKVFKKCAACHQVGEGAKNRTGPVLNGVIGATIAHVGDFKYSKDFTAAHDEGFIWTIENLTEYLHKPKAMFPKTKMSFAGLKKDEEIAAVIEYLKSASQ